MTIFNINPLTPLYNRINMVVPLQKPNSKVVVLLGNEVGVPIFPDLPTDVLTVFTISLAFDNN
jgi:hypothetical protein